MFHSDQRLASHISGLSGPESFSWNFTDLGYGVRSYNFLECIWPNSCALAAALWGRLLWALTSSRGEGRTWWFAILIYEMLASADVCLFFDWKGCCSQVASTAVRLSQETKQESNLAPQPERHLGVLSTWNWEWSTWPTTDCSFRRA